MDGLGELDYKLPVSQLLKVGEDAARQADWPNYVKQYGFTNQDIPELIRLATDGVFNSGDPESTEVWGPLHAWRTLGQLHAEEAAVPLLKLLDSTNEDWTTEELPTVYAMIGPSAIPVLAEYILRPLENEFATITAGAALREIGLKSPASKTDCIKALAARLEQYQNNDPGLNGFLIYDIAQLQGTEALPLIQRAFEAGVVDEMVAGDLGDTQIAMGLTTYEALGREKPDMAALEKALQELAAAQQEAEESFEQMRPRSRTTANEPPISIDEGMPASGRGSSGKRAFDKDKAKAKRKMAAASRKKNRKKK